jgi:hypothetical protein
MSPEQPRVAPESDQITAENHVGDTTTARVPIADLLSDGLAHHQAGSLAEAEVYYRQILAATPGHADALHLLGVIDYQRGWPNGNRIDRPGHSA